MNFKREKIHNYYLHDTPVENVFINEYLIDAPGDYVKVYLFALMYAQLRITMNNHTIAKQLALPEEDVLKAWSYWEGKGVIRRHYPEMSDHLRYNVEFLNLKEEIYGKNGKSKRRSEEVPPEMEGLMNDQDLRKMYSQVEQLTGRIFEGKEPGAILDWIKEYRIEPELVVFAYDYCVNKRKNNRFNYVAAVVKEWAGSGIKSRKDAEEHLAEHDNRHYQYRRIMKFMGFSRNATEEEKRIMDVWFDELGLDLPGVLEACKKTSGISNPNINYVNSILKAWSNGDKRDSGKPASQDTPYSHPIREVLRTYDAQRAINEKAAQERREEVYQAVDRIRQIEEEIRKLSLTISREMLSGGRQRIEEKKKAMERLNEERSYLLTDNNFPLDYMEVRYTCTACKDTGSLENGERCTCFQERLAQEQGKKI